jgi:PAS domain S-box-containing protein
MAKKPARPAKATALRQRAEEQLRMTKHEVAAMSTTGVQQLVHELQVHQVEMEMQNEELRRAQVALEVARDRYADLYEFSPVGVLTLDAQGRIMEANLMAATLLGLTRNKLMGQVFGEFILGEDRDVLHCHAQQVLKGGTPYFCEVRLQNKSVIPCWILLKSHAIPDESGRLTHWQTAFLDISVRKHAEAELQGLNMMLEQRVKERAAELVEANERWDWVVRATNDGAWDWDVLHDTAYFSPRWKEMHGFRNSDEPESTKEWSARIHPDDRPRVLKNIEEYLTGQQAQFWEEYRIQKLNGPYIWVLDRGIAIFNDQGCAIRMVGAETDITWRKEAEETLRRREHEFKTLADNVPAFFSYVDSTRRFRFVNNRYEDFFGRSNAEFLGMTLQDLHGPDAYAQMQPYLDKAFAGETVSFESEWKSRDGKRHYLSVQYVPDRDEQGQVRGLFKLLTDITALKSSEAQLREGEAQLRDLSAQLLRAQEEERRRIARELHDDVTQRLAALSMELHSLSFSTSEHDTALSSCLKGLGERTEQVATDLQRMAHRLHPSILEHAGLVAAVREHLEEFGARTGLSVELLTRGMLKAIPLDYATCLYRVLQESLQNVHKHANATNVLVRLLEVGQGMGLCVHDDGCGFVRLGEPLHHKGLGLTSMMERVGMLHGTFRIRTKPGHGTEIHAWLPLEKVNRKT